jgi:hypothetical protein
MLVRPDNGRRASGCVVFEGPSAVDGEQLIVILTGFASKSRNAKTGPMVQGYILAAGASPAASARQGFDETVCGDCSHRSIAAGGEGSCYVNLGQGPRAVWEAWTRGIYPRVSPLEACAAIAASGRGLRIGAYGDPASVPSAGDFWGPLVEAAAFHTGYTHAAHLQRGKGLRGMCHASADSPAERDRFRADGWSTFRVGAVGEPERRVKGEARCPAVASPVTCSSCPLLCNGRGTSIYIAAHGSTRKRFRSSERLT